MRKPDDFLFLVPIGTGLLWNLGPKAASQSLPRNVMVRAGMLDRFLAVVTCGRLPATHVKPV